MTIPLSKTVCTVSPAEEGEYRVHFTGPEAVKDSEDALREGAGDREEFAKTCKPDGDT